MTAEFKEKNKKKRKVRHLAVGISIFICAAIVGIVFLSYLYRPVTDSRRNICGFYAEPDNTLDMIYVGGSAAYCYWEPLQAWNDYGFTSYNFAADAMPPHVIKYILEEISKTQSPKLLLIDLRPFEYGEQKSVANVDNVAAFRNVSDSFSYSWNRFQMIENGAPAGEEKWSYHFDFSKYHSLMGSALIEENQRYSDNKEELYSKGFKALSDIQIIERYDLSNHWTRVTKLTDEINTLFIDLLEYCRENELQVLFVVHDYQLTGDHQEKYNYMQLAIEEYGFDFINVNEYYEETGISIYRDFANLNHVNLLGADKYTAFLANYLNKNYDLPDKREDSEYASWHECFQRWNEEMNIIRQKMTETN